MTAPSPARIGAVVDPRRIGAGVVQRGHQRHRPRRYAERGQHDPAPALERQPGGQYQRPHEVELLLERQRPVVLQQRRAPEAGEVRVRGEDLVPVVDVEDRGQRVDPELSEIGGEERRHHDHADDDHGHRGGQQAPSPCAPEPEQVQRAGAPVLGQQQRCDQVAAEDEEDIDAEEPARQPRDAGVVQQHAGHRDRPDPVQAGGVAKPAAIGRGPRRSADATAHRGSRQDVDAPWHAADLRTVPGTARTRRCTRGPLHARPKRHKAPRTRAVWRETIAPRLSGSKARRREGLCDVLCVRSARHEC
jgi:hypothetical protein